MRGGDSQEYRPTDDTEDEDAHDGDTAGLAPIGERGQEKHDHESDDVRRDGEQLGIGVRFSESFDDGGKETADRAYL